MEHNIKYKHNRHKDNVEHEHECLSLNFNVKPEDPSLAPIRARMQNCRDIAAKTDDKATCHDWGKIAIKIDYIWVKGFSSCIEYETITKPYVGHTFVSDHYPIKAKLIF